MLSPSQIREGGDVTIEEHYQQACFTPCDINEHLPTLRRYAEQCQHVTEFGVRGVVSTWALLAAMPKALRSWDIVHCPIEEAMSAASGTGISFEFKVGDTREIVIEPTDLLFIDTLHTADQLRQELSRHADNVRKFIICHDTVTFGQNGEAPNTDGLNVAIDKFLQAHPATWTICERFLNNNGLTVLARIG